MQLGLHYFFCHTNLLFSACAKTITDKWRGEVRDDYTGPHQPNVYNLERTSDTHKTYEQMS